MRSILSGAMMLLATLPSFAQIEWLSTEYDFGTFPEAGGPRSGEVRFINRGKQPTMINNVRLTCGCTSEAHTEGEIAPGDTARVRFTYNPIGRPGRFEKSIKVYTGVDNDLTTVKMKGTVIGTPQTLSTEYPFEVGPLRLSGKSVDFGKVRYGSSRHQFIVVYNQSSSPLHPVWKADEGLDVNISTPDIPPGELATISIYFNSREQSEMGPVAYTVAISPDVSMPDQVFAIPIRGEIQPDTEHLTDEQIANGPRAEVQPRKVDLGIVNLSRTKHSETFPIDFVIANEGKSTLNIMRIFGKDVPVRVRRFPSSIRPGKTGKAETTVNLRKIPAGPFNFKIEVMTDDPIHPVTVLSVCGEIE